MSPELIFEILLVIIVLLITAYYHERKLRKTYQEILEKREKERTRDFHTLVNQKMKEKDGNKKES